MELDELVLDMGNKLLEMGTSNVQVMAVETKTKLAKHLIICTAENNILARNVALDFKECYKEQIQCLHTDGAAKGEWVVIDYKDIIVHIFTKEARQKYNIEKLYKDAKNTVQITSKN